MPEKRSSDLCIICRQPSPTVVCMRCFFNYDYRKYEEEKAGVTSVESPLYSQVPEIPEENRYPNWEPMWEDPKENSPTEEEEKKKKSPVSWISRLPRFY